MTNEIHTFDESATRPHIAHRLIRSGEVVRVLSACTGVAYPELTVTFTRVLRTASPENIHHAWTLVSHSLHTCSFCTEAITNQFATPLDNTDTLELVVRSLACTGIDANTLSNEIIVAESEHHLGLIHHEIRKLTPRLPDRVEHGDLLGYGWRGLRMALRQYDPYRGYKFSSFACPKINGAIRDGLRSEHHLPKRLTTFSRKVDSVSATLTASLTRTPTYTEIADWMDLTPDQRRYLPLLPPAASLDDDATATGTLTAGEGSDPGALAEQAVARKAISNALSSLDETSAAVVTDMYVYGHTLRYTAQKHQLTQRDVTHVRDIALQSLRAVLADWDPGQRATA
jgi:RNA polymerase sigma factor for flagellar operon FliA